jgi:hypothetical protein
MSTEISLSWKADVELGILSGDDAKASDVESRDMEEDLVFRFCSLDVLDDDPENIGVENLSLRCMTLWNLPSS